MKQKCIILLLLFAILFSCERETQYDLPVVFTGEVTNISKDGATLNARITNYSNEMIFEYGFVIDKNKLPSSGQGKIVIKDVGSSRDFSFDLQSGLKNHEPYNIRSFIRTSIGTIYGNSVSFISQGSNEPKIKDFHPKMGPIGTKVIIEGENFGHLKKEIQIKFGNVTVPVDSLSDQRIYITIPAIDRSEIVNINIETAGMKTASANSFSLWFPWKNIANYYNFWCEAFFQIDNLGYMLQRGEVHIFNLETLKWEESKFFADNSIAVQATSLNDKGYVLFNNSFWEFNPSANQWKKIAFPPIPFFEPNYLNILYYDRYYYFLTVLNNNIILGSLKDNRGIWEYDIDSNKWSYKSNITRNLEIQPSGSFSEIVENKLYVGLKSNSGSQFWLNEPENNEWKYIGNLPIDSYSFWGKSVIDNKLYLCFGKNHVWPMESSNEVWEFNPVKNDWKQFHYCPENSIVSANFTYNNKAYFLTPWTIWEFDPLKN